VLGAGGALATALADALTVPSVPVGGVASFDFKHAANATAMLSKRTEARLI
jgi:hypothetical protein